jgi:hypothetical protein
MGWLEPEDRFVDWRDEPSTEYSNEAPFTGRSVDREPEPDAETRFRYSPLVRRCRRRPKRYRFYS